MKVTPDIIHFELIGTKLSVCKSKHQHYNDISGKILNETRNTFVLTDNRIIIKGCAVFEIQFSDGTIVEVDGKLLIGRTEDRLKRHIRRLW